ncbi:ZIP family metal transporter (plasmid) [Ureibacillus chungkukjangi]|uniref:ZIP family metal transporter n=1 Tax=Ureibacillus chungkukjangi TaxID=1202712 RepID=UPI000D3A55B4|nr:ZIP family metal transporter [Ureibacillus chungkukjangi]MCM3390655.1 ZIP family metal transporter [Ureibacillus chungkukjangi]HCG4535973.1 ZIP family metal transporter [Salmonella enterica subsp. enterica serovar Typhi str. AG3]
MWLLGFLSTSLGMLVGGSIAWLFKGFKNRIDTIYAICTGAIFSLIIIEILPEALETGGLLFVVVGLSLGIISFEILHNGLHNHKSLKGKSKNMVYLRTGLLLILSVSIHNLPMGIILGVNQDYEFTLTLLQTLFFHSIPEGIILFTPLFLAGMNIFIWLFTSFFVSIPVALGVLVGGFMETEYQIVSAILISFTAGIILMVTVWEILFPLLQKSPGYKLLISIFIGLLVMGLYLKLI